MSATEEIDTIVREIRQRVTRIESRVCRLGDTLNIQLTNPKHGLQLIQETAEVVEISTAVMDITLSELTSYLQRQKLKNRDTDIYFEGQLIATLYRTE